MKLPFISQYLDYAKWLGVAALIIVIFCFGYVARSLQDSNKYLKQEQQQTEAAKRETATAQALIAASDQKHTQEMNDAKIKIDTLRNQLASGRLRFSVPSRSSNRSGMPTASGSSSVDHGSQRCELDSATSQCLIGIADDGDQSIRQLTACQESLTALNNSLRPH